jgi:lipoate-protein ligase A
MAPCYLIVDPPADGAWNMAVDEALLERAANDGETTLRFYQWREPTLSLGYAQRYADRALHPPSQGAAAVRRLSGGGALLHDRELTYSLCLPADSALAAAASQLYSAVHGALIETFAALGVPTRLYGAPFPQPTVSRSPPEPFLCFARRGANDIVHDEVPSTASVTKIVGSAQRRSRGGVLQHGAILLGRSPKAPELPGANDLSPIDLRPEDLVESCSKGVAERLNLRLSPPGGLAKTWHERSHRLAEKYASYSWTARR